MARERLLIIEDDEDIRTQLTYALQDEYDVSVAGDRASAAAAVQHDHPEIVTLDLGLPPSPDSAEEGLRALESAASLAIQRGVPTKTSGTESGVIVAAPVYNYDVSASAKNMIELTGSAWEDKIVGFLCAAGGMSSYMSVMAYANSLMLDFRCVIIPRFAYATGEMFDDDRITDPKIIQRVEQVAAELVRFTEALRG